MAAARMPVQDEAAPLHDPEMRQALTDAYIARLIDKDLFEQRKTALLMECHLDAASNGAKLTA